MKTTTFELAVHLKTSKASHHLKNWIASSGGLVHPSLELAREAARRITLNPEVYYVNVSKATLQSMGIIQ